MPNIGFGVALAALMVSALLSYRSARGVAKVAEARRLHFATLEQLQELLASAMDIETGERGYVVTGDPAFLEPFNSGLKRLAPQVQGLRAAIVDTTLQYATLTELEETAKQLAQFDGQVVSFKANRDDAAALRAVTSGRGKQIMDRFRDLIATLGAEQREQLEQGDLQFQANLRWNMFVIISGSLVGFAAVGLAAVAINRSLRSRTRMNLDLRRSLAANTQMLDQLSVAGTELSRSNLELEQFAYVASHDLQEPLRKVSSFAQLLAIRYTGKLDAEADDFIAFMVSGVQRMHALIQDLLIYSRLGRKGGSPAPVDCNVVLTDALANLHEAIAGTDAAITSESLPTVLANELQLVQLFQNLIGNAIKFHGAERPQIHIWAKPDGPAWKFSVRDNGIGIDPHFAERIFVIFQRLHTREEYPGTGFGLALCKKIVERHGGRIWVESQLGQGSTFHFTFPRSLGRPAAPSASAPGVSNDSAEKPELVVS
jgi:signal transduction histidine kinase